MPRITLAAETAYSSTKDHLKLPHRRSHKRGFALNERERNENANEMADGGDGGVDPKVGANAEVCNAITNAGGVAPAALAASAGVGIQPGVTEGAMESGSGGLPLLSPFRSSEMVDLSTKVPH